MRRLASNLALALLSCIVAFAILEFSVYFLYANGKLPIRRPTYKFFSQFESEPSFWADINPVFGVWHRPNSTFKHRRSCFDVTYRSNSIGARDREREARKTGKRVVVLGDSFIEGFGLSDEQRLSNLLQKRTKIEHLNFGSGGDFGPLQYYLLYKTLAKNFQHDCLLVGILPANDFLDVDYDFGKKVHGERYRPYLEGEYPNYQLVYYQHDFASSTWGQGKEKEMFRWTLRNALRRFLLNYTYSFNAQDYVRTSIRYQASRDMTGPERGDLPYSGYYDFTEAQFAMVRYSMEHLVAEAAGVHVCFFTIPVLADLQRYSSHGAPALPKRLAEICDSIGAQYLDLLPYMCAQTADWSAYYLPCDGHPSDYGAVVQCEFLLQNCDLYKD